MHILHHYEESINELAIEIIINSLSFDIFIVIKYIVKPLGEKIILKSCRTFKLDL